MKKIQLITAIILAQLQFTSAQWQIKSSNLPNAQLGLLDMAAPDNHNCYGIGYDSNNLFNNNSQYFTVTHDGGNTWQVKPIDELPDNWIAAVAASSANTVHALGWDYANGIFTNLVRSTDGGNSWEPEIVSGFTAASFPDVIQFFNSKDGIIFGDPLGGYFEIYTTHNGGNTWNRVSSANVPASLPNEYGITFESDINGNTMWAVSVIVDNNFNPSGTGRLLQSDDKGTTWYVRNASLPFNSFDGVIRFRNHSVGLYKNNGILYRTTDGGTTWNQVNYTGTFFTFDFDNLQDSSGIWISTGGDVNLPANSMNGIGSSVTFDDGDHWTTIDTAVNHTCIELTNPVHGYSGGITNGNGNDGAFLYSFPPGQLHHLRLTGNSNDDNVTLNIYPNPSADYYTLTVKAETDQECIISIYDLEGSMIQEQRFNSMETIRFGNDLAKGIYEAVITSPDNKYWIQLIKE